MPYNEKMQTDFSKKDDVIIVRLKGHADFESVAELNQTCNKYLLHNKKVIFNLAHLNFVGSNGVAHLINILKNLKTHSSLKMCSVGEEFQRIFADSRLGHLEIYEDEKSAKQAFSQPRP